MAKREQPRPAVPTPEPGPAFPPPDNPLFRATADEPCNADEARAAALARIKALEDAARMENRPDSH